MLLLPQDKSELHVQLGRRVCVFRPHSQPDRLTRSLFSSSKYGAQGFTGDPTQPARSTGVPGNGGILQENGPSKSILASLLTSPIPNAGFKFIKLVLTNMRHGSLPTMRPPQICR